MPCNNPLKGAYLAVKKTDKGNRGITFNRREAYTDMPIPLPCGKCLGCFKTKRNEKAIQLFHESQTHQRSAMHTLTFSDENLPRTMEEAKRRVIKFLNSYRKKRERANQQKIKYQVTVERGDQTKRLHAHLIVFGEDEIDGAIKMGEDTWSNPGLEKLWGYGQIMSIPVTPESALYVLPHNYKRQSPDEHWMSGSKNIGNAWLDKFADDIVRTGHTTINGYENAVPKAYLRWREETFAEIIKERREYYENLPGMKKAVKELQSYSRELNIKAQLELKGKKI